MKFKRTHTDGRARRGEVVFARGRIDTPACMPVGTYGTVKAMTPEEVSDTGAQIILGNTFHLMLRPGTDIINQHGSLHDFMNWQSYPDRFRRFPGLQPGRAAQDYRGGRDIQLSRKR